MMCARLLTQVFSAKGPNLKYASHIWARLNETKNVSKFCVLVANTIICNGFMVVRLGHVHCKWAIRDRNNKCYSDFAQNSFEFSANDMYEERDLFRCW